MIDTQLLTEDKLRDLNEDQSKVLRQTRQKLREEGEQLLASEETRLRDVGWSESTELRMGDPAEEIIHAAEALKPDLVVLGSHGIMGIEHFLLGSVSDRVLEHACCSVLVVKKASPKLSMQPGPDTQPQP